MAEYLSLANAVITGVIATFSSFLAVWATNHGNNRRTLMQHENELAKERMNLTRERGEEIYQHADEWQRNVGANSLIWLGAMGGSYTASQALDMEIKRNSGISYDFGRLEMLVDVYFPTTRDSLSVALNECHICSEIISHFKKANRMGLHEEEDFPARLRSRVQKFERAYGVFRSAIVDQLRRV